MSANQRYLDNLIINKNKNESYYSPLKNNPNFQNDLYFKGKLHGNKIAYNRNNEITSKENNYYDIQNKYIANQKVKPEHSSEEYLNQIIYRNQSPNPSRNLGSPQEPQTLRVIPTNSANIISSTKPYENEVNQQPKISKPNYQNNDKYLSNSNTMGNYGSSIIKQDYNYSSMNRESASPGKKSSTEYTDYYKKYDNVNRGTEEYLHNKVVGYGRSIVTSPYKDYSKFFK